MRAIVEFNLIENGDRVLIGLSGGKDSILLTYALAVMQKHLKLDFTIGAFTVNPMFSEDFALHRLEDFCHRLNIPYAFDQVDIAGIIRQNENKSPCYSCAYFRRGAVNRYAKENGYNKVAYAHHHDDAVETFFMSILYSGQVKTFTPKTYLDKTDLTVIRPLIYLREDETRSAVDFHGFSPVTSPCPFDGNTTRQKIKELINKLETENPLIYEHLAAAMRINSVGELWPAAKSRNELREDYLNFVHS